MTFAEQARSKGGKIIGVSSTCATKASFGQPIGGQINILTRLPGFDQSTAFADYRTLVDWRYERHNGAMPSVQIKDVPEEVHDVLRRRAALAHQSLQEYLRSWLIEETSRPTLDEVLDRAGGRSGGSVPLNAAVTTLRNERARR